MKSIIRFKRKLPNQGRKENSGKAFAQLLLVLAGGLVGVLGNQFFFERNRRFEVTMELQRDFIKQQLPIYNRILNFTYSQYTAGYYKVTYRFKPKSKYDPLGVIYGREYKLVSTDTTKWYLPNFINDTTEERDLREDLRIIKENKDKIDPDVWEKFSDLTLFLKNHPIPACKIPDSLVKSEWVDSTIHLEWAYLNTELHSIASGKIERFIKKDK